MTRRRATGSAPAGFTLLEIVVALALLGLLVVSAQAVLTDRLAADLGLYERRGTLRDLVLDRAQEARLLFREDATLSNLPGVRSSPRSCYPSIPIRVGNQTISSQGVLVREDPVPGQRAGEFVRETFVCQARLPSGTSYREYLRVTVTACARRDWDAAAQRCPPEPRSVQTTIVVAPQ